VSVKDTKHPFDWMCRHYKAYVPPKTRNKHSTPMKKARKKNTTYKIQFVLFRQYIRWKVNPY